ncbi:MAG: Stk1 family PASTA domain-containing Ser/Thr kinase [Oscillospiraceae bacterium]|nr:Stk1 family PASTA domain-containing Ser/Thr kinase [Oscillospiraceae bacterium]
MENQDKYIGQILDERYEILELIGEGGMSVVYKATDRRLNRSVAVKIMRDEMASDEEFRRNFCAEAHAVAMLSNPNIVGVYDVSHSDDIEYIVMELVDGITLRQYMDKRGVLNWREVLHFTRQIARALSHAHERGIIHRDIKPQNILMLRDGTIKVEDFGIAALENEAHESDGQAIGSIHYIAPEQARGELPDARSDLYSLGVVMYEMLTGQKPYEGETIGEIAVKHMNAQAVAPHELVPEVPAELERITFKAMCADITQRYQSANELLEDLDAFVQEQLKKSEPEKKPLENPAVMPIRSVSEMNKERFRLRHRRARRVTFLMGTFGALALCLALFVFMWDFWLAEVFTPAERITLPNFCGKDYQRVVDNAEYASLYSFDVVYVIDTETESGTILSQDPDPGRSMMITPEGIKVELSVSTGMVFTEVPDVVNLDYREAKTRLQQAGFIVDIENETSGSVTKDYVIRTSPSAGEQMSSGSTVYVTVSTGPQTSYVRMPNVIGLSEEAAISKLENAGLSYGGSDWTTSDVDAGTVIGQSAEAFTEIEEHAKIYLKVSSGPMV